MDIESSSQVDDAETASQSEVGDSAEESRRTEDERSSESDEDDLDQPTHDEDGNDVIERRYFLRNRKNLRKSSTNKDIDTGVSRTVVSSPSKSKGKKRAAPQSDNEDDSMEVDDDSNTPDVYCLKEGEYWTGSIKLPDGFWPFRRRDRRIGRMQLAVSQCQAMCCC